MEPSRAVKRVMDRYNYTYEQCCTMPFILLVFLHTCAKMEEEKLIPVVDYSNITGGRNGTNTNTST